MSVLYFIYEQPQKPNQHAVHTVTHAGIMLGEHTEALFQDDAWESAGVQHQQNHTFPGSKAI